MHLFYYKHILIGLKLILNCIMVIWSLNVYKWKYLD